MSPHLPSLCTYIVPPGKLDKDVQIKHEVDQFIENA